MFLITILAYAQDSQQDYIDVHNIAKGQVGVPPIAWDATVAEYAENHANQHKDDCKVKLSHRKYGELLQTSSGNMSGANAVKMWVAQKADYDYNTNTCVGWTCLGYAQVVWRNSTHLECSKVNCANAGTFIICNWNFPNVHLGPEVSQQHQ